MVTPRTKPMMVKVVPGIPMRVFSGLLGHVSNYPPNRPRPPEDRLLYGRRC